MITTMKCVKRCDPPVVIVVHAMVTGPVIWANVNVMQIGLMMEY